MKKFLFDTIDFDSPEAAEDAPILNAAQAETLRHEAMSRGEQEGYAKGRTEAEEAARNAVEEKLSAQLEGVSAALERLITAEDRREMEKCIDAARLALHVVHKLMPQLAANHALPEIENIISSAIDARHDEPRIAVTVPAALLETLKARIDRLAQDRGYGGKMILIADDGMAPSDCRVEWADGGSERIVARLMMQIEGEFSRALAGMQVVAAEKKTETTEEE